MQDIFAWYKQGLLFYGPYRNYFGRSQQQSEYLPKTSVEYSREPISSKSGERERIEQQPDYKMKDVESKPEVKNENVQEKAETQPELKKKERPAESDIEKIGW